MIENTIRMPKRFDYGASSDFNNSVASILNDVNGEGAQILLDCSQTDYIDSAGIGLLVMAHKKAITKRASIIIVSAKPSTREVLLLANLQKLIEVR